MSNPLTRELLPERPIEPAPLSVVERLTPEQSDELYLGSLEAFNLAQHQAYSGVDIEVDRGSSTVTIDWKGKGKIPLTSLTIKPEANGGEQIIRLTRATISSIPKGYKQVINTSELCRQSCQLKTYTLEQEYDMDHWGLHPQGLRAGQPKPNEGQALMKELRNLQENAADDQADPHPPSLVTKIARNLGGFASGIIAGRH